MNQDTTLQQLERDIRANVNSNGVYKKKHLLIGNRSLDKLPDISDIIINGILDVSINKLKNLVGAPNKVDFLDAFSNQIDTLVGSPQEIETIDIRLNNLRSFKGLSPTVENVYAYDNPIESFEGLPKKLKYLAFTCNNIKSWNHFPQSIENVFVNGNTQSIQLKDRLRILQSAIMGNCNDGTIQYYRPHVHDLLKQLFGEEYMILTELFSDQ